MDDDIFIPHITRSRTVTRLPPEPIVPHSPLIHPEKRYGPEFWDRLMKQPSVYNAEVAGSVSVYPTWRTDVKWDSTPPLFLDPLPPPSVLFKGKKKKSPAERSMTSVEKHIQELRKKQSSIDQLKTMKWGGYKVCEVEQKKEIQSDGGRAGQERNTFFSFLEDDVESREQDMPIFSFSPARSPGGIWHESSKAQPNASVLIIQPTASVQNGSGYYIKNKETGSSTKYHVEFPWMSPQDHVSTCFLDSSDDGWGAEGGFL